MLLGTRHDMYNYLNCLEAAVEVENEGNSFLTLNSEGANPLYVVFKIGCKFKHEISVLVLYCNNNNILQGVPYPRLLY